MILTIGAEVASSGEPVVAYMGTVGTAREPWYYLKYIPGADKEAGTATAGFWYRDIPDV